MPGRLFFLSRASMRWLGAELVVVVLGILIAFQIEAWRDERSLREEERTILNSILQELEQDASNLSNAIAKFQIGITAIDEFTTYLGSADPEHAEIARHWRHTLRVRTYLPTSNAFTSAKNNARLFVISDSEISSLLLDYYDVQQPLFTSMYGLASTYWQAIREVSKPDLFGASGTFTSPNYSVFAVAAKDNAEQVLNIAVRHTLSSSDLHERLASELGDYYSMQRTIHYQLEVMQALNARLREQLGEHLLRLGD